MWYKIKIANPPQKGMISMEYSIQQIAQELVRKITEKVINGGICDIDKLSSTVLGDCKTAAREIIQTVIEELNKQIREDKAGRKEQKLVLKEKERKRQLLTELGMLEFKRDYYQEKVSGEYVYPLDEALNIASYERIGKQVCAKLVQQATDVSYAKSSKIVTGGEVSRQTVRRQILRAASLEKEPEEEQRQVKELHIYADEDHVHLQKPKKKKGKYNQILPLITVTEGMKKESTSRNRTIRPVRFVDEEFEPKRLWESVSGYIAKTYDLDALEKIYVHGDGGNWIGRGLEEYVQKVDVMDGYHLEKRLREISKEFPNQRVNHRLTEAILNNDQLKAKVILTDLWKNSEDTKSREKLKEFEKYLFRHWEGIRRRKSGVLPGSCTEGQVSHVIAERFSRDPLGWSKAGLGKLSKLRVYVINGGEITGEAFETQEQEQHNYREYMEQMIQEHLRGAIDWSIFEKEKPLFHGDSGTQVLIKEYGRCSFSLLN